MGERKHGGVPSEGCSKPRSEIARSNSGFNRKSLHHPSIHPFIFFSVKKKDKAGEKKRHEEGKKDAMSMSALIPKVQEEEEEEEEKGEARRTDLKPVE